MQYYVEKVQKEDLLLFMNACFSSTGQEEFYESAYEQNLNLDFLHEYMLINYRDLYFKFLYLNINHHNKAKIIFNLLYSSKNKNESTKKAENIAITQALKNLPTNRVYKLFAQIKKAKINNSRTRAIIKTYINSKKDLAFECVKYKSKLKGVFAHIHLKTDKEVGDFLFKKSKNNHYTIELFKNFQKAHYDKEALYELPFTIAEGFAVKYKIERSVFLKKIQNKMTLNEKLRLQTSSEKNRTTLNLDWEKIGLTQLVLYILSLPFDKRKENYDDFLNKILVSSKKLIAKNNFNLAKTALILDTSYSSSGSSEKARRPLALALAGHFLLKETCTEYKAFWTSKFDKELLAYPRGQTNIAEQLIYALEYNPQNLIIISDGYENDPTGACSQIISIYNKKFAKDNKIKIFHFNPVFEAKNFEVKKLSEEIITMGIREIEDLPFLIKFASFLSQTNSFKELNNYFDSLAFEGVKK